MEKYGKHCEQIGIGKIDKVEYISTMNAGKNTWYIKAVTRYEIMVIFIFLVGLIMLRVEAIEIENNFIYIPEVLFLIELFFPLAAYFPLQQTENIRHSIMYIFGDEHGFFIEAKKNKKVKRRFVFDNSYQILEKKYIRYMQSFNSLTAFVKVAIEKKASKKTIEEIIEVHINGFYNKPYNVVELLPYFIIGYIMFEENRKMKCIKELYKKLQLEREQMVDFQIMLCSHIYYLEKKHKIGYLDGDKAKYIKWLCYN